MTTAIDWSTTPRPAEPANDPEPWEGGPPPAFDEGGDAPEARAERLRGVNARKAAAAGAACLEALLLGPAIAEPLEPLAYLVPEIGMVAGGGAPHLVAGYGFSGKTLALQSLLLSLAAGRGIWGGYTGRQARVVHVDLEQGRRLTCRRYQRLALALVVDLASLGDALAVSVMPRLSLTVEHRDAWRALMTGRDVMLIDSLRAATGGQDENSSEMRAGIDMLGGLSEETECRVLVIHHARKASDEKPNGGAQSIRGSGAIFDAVDGAYIFSAAKGEPVSVEHVKARTHGELVDAFALVISDVPDEWGGDLKAGLRVQVHGGELVRDRRESKARQARQDKAATDADTVRKVLASRPGLGTRELRSVAGLGNGPRLADALAVLGVAVEVRDERRGRTVAAGHYLTGSGVT